jgi:hypothetical protein
VVGDHVPERTGPLVKFAAPQTPIVSAAVIWIWSMCARFQSAGTTRRLIKSPAAPKITMAQDGAAVATVAASFLPRHFLPPSISRARSTIRSGSSPNLRCSSLSGAEAPKVSMPMTLPAAPA